jgi:cyclic pyranopterin phosphate synthase
MTNQLTDKFNRKINYLRLSVTDRCDFRCLYCMSEKMTFLPRKELLTLEELQRVGEIFISLGVNKIRITGGEPLVRKDIDQLFNALGQNAHLKELTLTTNASQLKSKAPMLLESGVKRINISLDSLDRGNFKKITRTGNLDQIIENIRFASGLGFEKIKLNSVLMKGTNDHEIFSLIDFALKNQFDISFIEEMPLGHIEHERGKTWIDNDQSLKKIQSQYNLTRSTLNTGGPAKYWHIDNSQTHIGFISPHSNNFCESCNRVRVSCKGELFLCLGQDEKIELAPLLRKYPSDDEPIKKAIINAMSIKPESHEFNLNEKQPAVIRFMSHTGG